MCWPPDRTIRPSALGEDTVLYSWVRHSTLSVFLRLNSYIIVHTEESSGNLAKFVVVCFSLLFRGLTRHKTWQNSKRLLFFDDYTNQ